MPIKHTAQPGSTLARICNIVCDLKPFQRISFDRATMQEIPVLKHNGVTWTPGQRVLENIIGSKYTHSTYEDMMGNTVFCRHEENDTVRWESPDDEIRREGLRKRRELRLDTVVDKTEGDTDTPGENPLSSTVGEFKTTKNEVH